MSSCLHCGEVAQKTYTYLGRQFPCCYDCEELTDKDWGTVILLRLSWLKNEQGRLKKEVDELEKFVKTQFKDGFPTEGIFKWDQVKERTPDITRIPVDALEYAHKDWVPQVGKLEAYAKMKGLDTTRWYSYELVPRLIRLEGEV